MKSFNPITKRHHLSKLVANDVEKAILAKKYLPGAKLPSEQEFCRQFDVSRTAIREALQSLSARGLIRIEKGKGAFVEQFSSKTVTDPFYLFLKLSSNPEYIYDVLKVRQIIEPPVAGLAALNHTESDLQKLKQNLDKLKNHSNQIEEIAQFDMEFHLLLAKASGNELMSLILEPVHMLMPKIKIAIIESVSDAKDSAIEWHSRILDQITAGDAPGAEKAMKDHLVHAEEHIRKMIALRRNETDGENKLNANTG